MSGNAEHDEQLWRRFEAQASPTDSPPPDANLLAAYLEGSATADEVERIEGRLADDPQLLAELIELRRLAEAPPAAAPQELLGRAKALAAQPAATAGRSWWRQVQWAAAAAAIVVACWSGYSFGANVFSGQVKSAPSAMGAFEELMGEDELEIPGETDGGNGGAS